MVHSYLLLPLCTGGIIHRHLANVRLQTNFPRRLRAYILLLPNPIFKSRLLNPFPATVTPRRRHSSTVRYARLRLALRLAARLAVLCLVQSGSGAYECTGHEAGKAYLRVDMPSVAGCG